MSNSPYIGTHAFDRALRSMSPHNVVDLNRGAGADRLQELEQQYQVPISGTARSGIAWTRVPVAFDVHFMFAPEQRDSLLAMPHFTYGVVCLGSQPPAPGSSLVRGRVGAHDANNPWDLVAVFVHVTEWARDLASDAVIGAIVGIGVSTMGGGDVDFQGTVHLTFQGYGAVSEDEPATPDDLETGAPGG